MSKKLEDLVEHKIIVHYMRRTSNVVSFGTHEFAVSKPTLSFNDTSAMLECAYRGLGIVKLHEFMAAEAIAKGRLVEILGDYSAPLEPIYMYYKKEKIIQPKIRCFVDYFSEKMGI